MSEFQTEISKLSSNPIWPFFATICSIPHPSKHEEALAQYIINWAKEQGLAVRRDETGNVFIKKPATPGMENRKGVVLQAHIDMVPQKMKTQCMISPKIRSSLILMVNGYC